MCAGCKREDGSVRFSLGSLIRCQVRQAFVYPLEFLKSRFYIPSYPQAGNCQPNHLNGLF